MNHEKYIVYSWVLVAHACHPSNSGGRDQEGHDSKPAWANSSRDPLLKKPFAKKADGMAQGVGPEYCKNKQNNNKNQPML
jgi:hypothetical protein